MAERHPDDDLILDLALGHLDEPDRGAVAEHLVGCLRCREDFDALTGSIEHTLAAVPRQLPPPGFDGVVLSRLRQAGPGRAASGVGRGPLRPRARRRFVAGVAAAAAAVGIAAGVGGTVVLTGLDADPSPVAQLPAAGPALRTGEGEPVGYVTRSWDGAGWMLVVNVTDAPDGARYLCRVLTADGSTHAVGDWTVAADRANSWVVPEPEGAVRAVELVRPEDDVTWARADLD